MVTKACALDKDIYNFSHGDLTEARPGTTQHNTTQPYRFCGWQDEFSGVCALFSTLAVVASPLLLNAFVKYFNNEHKTRLGGLLLVGCLVIVKFTESFSQRHWFFNPRRSRMRMRSALIMAIYRKQLKLSGLARRRHSTGKIVNYITVNAYRMTESMYWFHLGWSLSVQLFLTIGVLFKMVGLSATPDLVLVLIIGFLNIQFAKTYNKCQSLFKVAQGERLRVMSDVFEQYEDHQVAITGRKIQKRN
ncbi:hypothetical protein LWI29_018940 [Acer saccharum]|uniref:ABC transmembrane type-1 domain-containing protein n=1 Tax=Acer saccharum TaxID=4024 RepID=A0AA39S945_ACESA|nr:hypothetical protein LWI29_018940 [Acer saccharum]